MGAFAGLMNHQMTAGQALTGNSANPLAASTAGTSSTSSAGSSSATISANDFLTLLVTEMQNQDPTAQTDPNEYINQLVQVNSLEQLIDINQNLSAVLGAATTPPGSGSGPVSSNQTPPGLAAPSASGLAARGPHAHGVAAHKAGGVTAAHSGGSRTGGSNTAAAISKFAQSAGAKSAPGNLSIPKAGPVAHRVAHALDGHSHAQSIPGKLPGA